ncbi:MAG: NYN domain-containing protein [Elusimicrobiaceae bacterium]
MRGSTKPTIYLIDGLNFIRTFLAGNAYINEENLTSELISWLDELGSDKLYGSEFRLFLDSSFRNVGPIATPCVHASFTEEYTADDIILEQAEYYTQYSKRAVVVTSDLELAARVRAVGIKSISCAKFFNAFYN